MWNGCFLGEDSVYLLLLWIVLEIGIFEGIEMEKVRLLNELLLDFKFRFELFALFTLESWVEGNKNRNGISNIASETKRHLPHRKKNLSKIRKKNSLLISELCYFCLHWNCVHSTFFIDCWIWRVVFFLPQNN